jgi:hypothetical protein
VSLNWTLKHVGEYFNLLLRILVLGFFFGFLGDKIVDAIDNIDKNPQGFFFCVLSYFVLHCAQAKSKSKHLNSLLCIALLLN